MEGPLAGRVAWFVVVGDDVASRWFLQRFDEI